MANLVLVPLYMLSVGPAARLRPAQRVFYCRVNVWLTGLRVTCRGRPCTEGAVLYAPNHVSYLDIPVLGSLVDASFVSKAEVKGWPLIGLIGRLTHAIFIRREAAGAKRQRDELAQRLAQGDNLILFPEGTSTDGSGVAPFRSSLFGVIDQPDASARLLIQPVSVVYTRCADGTPIEGRLRPLYAWFGDALLLPHVKRVLAMRGAEVEVSFHEPLRAQAHSDRKQLTQQVRNAVAAGVAAAQARAGIDDGRRLDQGVSAVPPAASAAERR